MLTINITHRSDASSAVKSHSADQELFWSSVTELKEKIDARLRHFDFERHHWVILPDARAQLVEYLLRMETLYGAHVEVGYETDAERMAREAEERWKAERQQDKEQRQAEEAEAQRRRSQQQHHHQRQNSGAKEQAGGTKRRKRTRQQRPAAESYSPFNRRMNAELAYATLYLTPDAPQEMIQAAWRTLAKIYHPDVGGDAATMARINDAYRFLQDVYKQRVDAA